MRAGHVRRGPGFIDEDQPLRIKIWLGFKPRLTPDQDVRPILFARMAGLFFV